MRPLIPLILGRSIIDLEIMITILANLQNRSQVSTSIAIVRRGPNRYELLVKHELVPFLHKLVRSGDEFERIEVIEFSSNAPAEEPTRTSRAYCPVLDLVRV